jgi:hypothetical protein
MKAKLYKLTINKFYYYGSTTQSLRQRFNEHKSWNKWKIEDWTNATIELIEEFECNNRREREQREDIVLKQHLKNSNCLNTRRAFVTKEERKIISKASSENWRNNNTNKTRNYSINRNKTYVTCNSCKCQITLPNLARHNKSNKHKNSAEVTLPTI